MKKHPPSISVVHARALRRAPTDAEQRIWRLLREFFPEARFRRQVPIRHYIADFASHSHKIIVEIDGSQHSPESDEARTKALEAEGYRVLRFWNSEVLENGEGCMIRLGQFVRQTHPHPTSASQHAGKPAYPSPIERAGA